MRAARVFRQPGGHMLLVGLDGTGKKTAVNLAAYITECEQFRLTLTRGYNLEHFREDLKKVCIRAGVKNTKTVFLMTDGDIVRVRVHFLVAAWLLFSEQDAVLNS